MSVRLLDGDEITVRDDELEDVAGGDAETTYTVKQIAPEARRSLLNKHTQLVINAKTGGRERLTDTDALLDDLIDYALVGWTGILIKGEPAPLARENKLKLDFQRRQALLKVAGYNQSGPADRSHSFRPPH